MATYSVQNDIIYEEATEGLALYKIINSYIESSYVFYDSSMVPDTSVDNVQDALDDLFNRRLKAGTAIHIDEFNYIHGDYKAGLGVKIIPNPETGEYDFITGDYKAGNAVDITKNVISLTYQAGTAVKIIQNTISLDYKEGVGIRIDRDIISGDYEAGNALRMRENTFIGDYKEGNAIRIDGDVIHGDYKAGTAINIYHNVIHAAYKAGVAVKIENDKIYGDYKGGNAIIVENSFIHGDYKAGLGVRLENDIVHLNYIGGVGIRIIDDRIYGDYKGGIAIEIDDDVISATYEAGVGVEIHGNVIRGTYIGRRGIEIVDNIIRGDYKAGVAIEIEGDVIHGAYKPGVAIKIEDNLIEGDYHAGTAIRIDGDVIRGIYKAGNAIKIQGDIISGDYKGGTAIDITGNVISGDYKSGNAIDINNDIINSCYRGGVGIKIVGDTIHCDYVAMTGVRIHGDLIYGDYKGGVAVNVYNDVIEGDYKGGRAIVITGNEIRGDYKGGPGIKIEGSTISGDYKGGNAVNITGNVMRGTYQEGHAIRIDADVISANYTAGTGIVITNNVIAGNYTGTNGVVVEGNVIRGNYIGGGCVIGALDEEECIETVDDVISWDGVLLGRSVPGCRYYENGTEVDGNYLIEILNPIAQIIYDWYMEDIGRSPEAHGMRYWYNDYITIGDEITTYANFYVGALLERELGRLISIITLECGADLYTVNPDGTFDNIECIPPGICGCNGFDPSVSVIDPTSITSPACAPLSDDCGTLSFHPIADWVGAMISMSFPGVISYPTNETVDFFNQHEYLKFISRHWNFNNSRENMGWDVATSEAHILASGHPDIISHANNWGWYANANPSDRFDLMSYVVQVAAHYNSISFEGCNRWTVFHVVHYFHTNGTSPLEHFHNTGVHEGLHAYAVMPKLRHDKDILLGPPTDDTKPYFIEEEYLQFQARYTNQLNYEGITNRTALDIKMVLLEGDTPMTPYQHFKLHGWLHGVHPSNNFDVYAYTRKRIAIQNRLMVDAAGGDTDAGTYGMYNMQQAFIDNNVDPLQHYILWGKAESEEWEIPAAFQVHPLFRVVPAEMGGDQSIGCDNIGEGNGFTPECIPTQCGISIDGNEISLNPASLDVYSAGIGIKIDDDKTIHGNYYAGTRIKIYEDEISMDLIPGPGILVCDGEISLDPNIIECCLDDDGDIIIVDGVGEFPGAGLDDGTGGSAPDPDPLAPDPDPPAPDPDPGGFSSETTINITVVRDGQFAEEIDTNDFDTETGTFYSDLGSTSSIIYVGFMGKVDSSDIDIRNMIDSASNRLIPDEHRSTKSIQLPTGWAGSVTADDIVEVTVYTFETYTNFTSVNQVIQFMQHSFGVEIENWNDFATLEWANSIASGWHEMLKLFPDVGDLMYRNIESTGIILAMMDEPPTISPVTGNETYTFGHISMPSGADSNFTITYNTAKTVSETVNDSFAMLADVNFIVGESPHFTTFHEFGHFVHYCNTADPETWFMYGDGYDSAKYGDYDYDFSPYTIPPEYHTPFTPPHIDESYVPNYAYAAFITDYMSIYASRAFPMEFCAETFASTILSSKSDSPEIQTCLDIFDDFNGWRSKYFTGY